MSREKANIFSKFKIHTMAPTKTTTSLPPPAKNRLTRELQQLSTAPPPGVAAYPVDESNISIIAAEITGPEDSPFEGGLFRLTIQIPARYPFEPPRCRFVNASAKKLYHPNVDSAGRICLDTLKSPPAGCWSPAVSLPSLLLTIRTLLSSPNGDDPLDPDIALIFRRNPDQWRREAKRRLGIFDDKEKLNVNVLSDGDREKKENDEGSKRARIHDCKVNEISLAEKENFQPHRKPTKNGDANHPGETKENPAKKNKVC